MPGSLPDHTRTPATPPSLATATFRTPQAPARTGWVYELPRPALERELSRFGLSTSGGVQELRRRLVNLTQHIMETDAADATFNASPRAAPAATPFIPPPAEYYYATPTLRTPVHVCETVRKWNIHFDGKTDPVAFLERVEELKASYHLTGEQLLLAIPELLRGTTLLWYRNYCDAWQQWADFVTDFRTFFLPPDYHLHLEEDINRRKQKAGEKGRDYIVDIQTLIRRHGSMSPAQAVYRIYTNMLPEYRQHIRRKDVTDIRTLSLEIAEYEELQKDLLKASPVRLASVHTQETTKPTTRTYDPRKACWRCGQEGHWRSRCTATPIKFCSRCGTQGVMSRDCTCAAKSGKTPRLVGKGVRSAETQLKCSTLPQYHFLSKCRPHPGRENFYQSYHRQLDGSRTYRHWCHVFIRGRKTIFSTTHPTRPVPTRPLHASPYGERHHHGHTGGMHRGMPDWRYLEIDDLHVPAHAQQPCSAGHGRHLCVRDDNQRQGASGHLSSNRHAHPHMQRRPIANRPARQRTS